LRLKHEIIHKINGKKGWFDNYIRIEKPGSRFHIDVYEYYWANLTENKAKLSDIQKWLWGTVKGAKKFYKHNARFGNRSGDRSLFFNAKGEFNYLRYRFFLFVMAIIVPGITMVTGLFLGFLGSIQFLGIGKLFSTLKEHLAGSNFGMISNVVGDITIYNTSDAKSEFYRIRRDILNGAVSSLQYLLEPDDHMRFRYGKVIPAGHSLGSQIAFDSINRINVMINCERIWGYNQAGYFHAGKRKKHISNTLSGFITFGSPLDKIAFFLREHVPDDEYIRLQLLNNYHSFKQRDWTAGGINSVKFIVQSPIKRHFDDIKWRNYYDKHDYVSGGLDYYYPLTNVNCRFRGSLFSFTHGKYWKSKEMFGDLMEEMIMN